MSQPIVVVFSTTPYRALASSFDVSWSHTTTRHNRQDSSGRVISPSQRSLPDNTQHSQQTNIHAPARIRTHDPSRRAAKDLRLRPHGHWDRLYTILVHLFSVHFINKTSRQIIHDSAFYFFSAMWWQVEGEIYQCFRGSCCLLFQKRLENNAICLSVAIVL